MIGTFWSQSWIKHWRNDHFHHRSFRISSVHWVFITFMNFLHALWIHMDCSLKIILQLSDFIFNWIAWIMQMFQTSKIRNIFENKVKLCLNSFIRSIIHTFSVSIRNFIIRNQLLECNRVGTVGNNVIAFKYLAIWKSHTLNCIRLISHDFFNTCIDTYICSILFC